MLVLHLFLKTCDGVFTLTVYVWSSQCIMSCQRAPRLKGFLCCCVVMVEAAVSLTSFPVCFCFHILLFSPNSLLHMDLACLTCTLCQMLHCIWWFVLRPRCVFDTVALNAAISRVASIICLTCISVLADLAFQRCLFAFMLFAGSLFLYRVQIHLAQRLTVHQIRLQCVYGRVCVLAGCSCFRLGVNSCQLGDCCFLQRRCNETLEEERNGRRGRRDQVPSGHHMREN